MSFFAALPPEDGGCLYYDPRAQRFVGTLPLPEGVMRHFGRPGDLLPLFVES